MVKTGEKYVKDPIIERDINHGILSGLLIVLSATILATLHHSIVTLITSNPSIQNAIPDAIIHAIDKTSMPWAEPISNTLGTGVPIAASLLFYMVIKRINATTIPDLLAMIGIAISFDMIISSLLYTFSEVRDAYTGTLFNKLFLYGHHYFGTMGMLIFTILFSYILVLISEKLSSTAIKK